jgi:hypothetical protein
MVALEARVIEVHEMKIRCLSLSIKKAALAALALILLGCSEANRKNVCPIDGQRPEWSGERKGSSCEYFHYSIVEKQTHSWWADCSTGQ